MASRIGTGWQTTLADLSLILFMITASAVTKQPPATAQAAPAKAAMATAAATGAVPAPSPRAEPLGVWIDGPAAPPLAQWLAEQARDPRQQVTIAAHYAPGGMAAAMARAQALAAEAGEGARIVIEPGASGLRVVIGYDPPPGRIAARMGQPGA